MSLASFSIIRHHRTVASAAPQLLRRFTHFPIYARNQNPKHIAPSKNLLKAKHRLKEFSSLAPILSREENLPLSESQAVGVVASSQANFMRVIVQSVPEESSRNFHDGSGSFHDGSGGVELLCVVRALLKKIKRCSSFHDAHFHGPIKIHHMLPFLFIFCSMVIMLRFIRTILVTSTVWKSVKRNF